jgi:hypothetical protein
LSTAVMADRVDRRRATLEPRGVAGSGSRARPYRRIQCRPAAENHDGMSARRRQQISRSDP